MIEQERSFSNLHLSTYAHQMMNKAGIPVLPFSYVISSPKNLNILVSCIMPIDKITNDQHVFIQAIINEITKLFVILNSLYYKKESKIFIEDIPDTK